MRRAPPPQVPRRDHRARAPGREPEGSNDHRALRRGARRVRRPLRHRVVRFRAQAAVEGYPRAPRQGARRVSQSHRLHHPPHGCDVRKLLHQGGDGDLDPRVCVRRRGNEEDHAEGGEAVRRNRWRGARVHSHRGDARVFQKLLGPAHGPGSTKLQPAGGDHAGDRAQGWGERDHRSGRGGPQGRVRAVQAHGDGDDHEGHREVGHRRRGREAGGASHRRDPVRVPGADGGRR
mmetsp:Transcript_2770/g.11306  ORF Transcript_2770/g.11306 Transcript_2770/m.11306 type:complete len:233 (+) Transcript_2770:1961-2659(+)